MPSSPPVPLLFYVFGLIFSEQKVFCVKKKLHVAAQLTNGSYS